MNNYLKSSIINNLKVVERIKTIVANNPGVEKAGRVLVTQELVLTNCTYIIPHFVKTI